MLDGILLLEEILGKQMFEKEVDVILTDRGSEFVLAEEAERREDGTRRTRMFYCDSMASWQKGSFKSKSHQHPYQFISKRKAARKIVHTAAPFLQRRNG